MQILQDVSLRPYNTFGIEAKAAYFVEVNKVRELQRLLRNEQLANMPHLILGGGSNVLFTQDFKGLVIKNSIKGIELLREDDERVWVKAMAGEVWHEFVLHCIEQGWAGLENLSLIPGQVGAAPMQNIGAYGVEIKEVFEELEAVNVATAELETFSREECKFGYRESIFKNTHKGRYIITSVTFRLNKQPSFNVTYGAIQDTLAEMGISKDKLSIKAISDAVIAIRSSKLPNPKELGNAGSFFKNPELEAADFAKLQAAYPSVPNYPQGDGRIKVPAGWLIEQAGWKGKQVGNTGSHAKQALVLVNYGNATGKEVYELAMQIKASVKEKFGVDINPEVNLI